MGWAPQGNAALAGTSNNLRFLQNGGPHSTAGVQSRGCLLLGTHTRFGTASRYPALTPLHPAGVPAGGPSCAAAATKGDEYVMLRCRWEGGTPPVTLRWHDSGGRALGDPVPSAAVLVLSANGSLGGREFVCAAAHPLWAASAECRLRLGKPDPSPRALPVPQRRRTSLPAPSPRFLPRRGPRTRGREERGGSAGGQRGTVGVPATRRQRRSRRRRSLV